MRVDDLIRPLKEGYTNSINRVQTYLDAGKIPARLSGLAAEARKAGSFEEFQRDFIVQIKHGLYWHWTDDRNFSIDPTKGPRDMSRMANGTMDPGKLMVTSHLENWAGYGNRQWVALIDMRDVPRNQYRQVSRGFGNEFFVNDPTRARVIKVMSRRQALRYDREYSTIIPQNFEQLKQFYELAIQTSAS